jgi:hypothetical protein
MNPNGRPKTRSLEYQMVAIYKLIHQTMINEESSNVSNACRAIFNNDNSIRIFKLKIIEGETDHFLTDLIDNPENLRKRYQEAKKSSTDADNYPILHHTVNILSEQLEAEIERHKQWREAHERENQEGRLVAYKHNLPTRFARKP